MEVWLDKVVDCIAEFGGDIVVENNQGGDAWTLLLKQKLAERGLTAKIFSKAATASKRDRAIPVAAAIKAGKMVKVGDQREVTQSLCTWLPGDPSPNRLDGMVWAVYDWVSAKQKARTPAGPMI